MMPDRNYYDRHEPNAIERDRMERRRQTRRKSMITNILVIAVVAAVVIGIIIAVVALTGGNKKADKTAEPTAVTATIASDTQQSKETTAKTKPTQAKTGNQNVAPASSQQDNNLDDNDADDAENSDTPSSQSTSGTASASSGAVSGGGSGLHYTATGQTSYGYDWTYSGGGGIVDVSCNYNFDTKQYDFVITGVSEGTTSLTLYYNTDDGVQQPVNMTVSVDSNLNVTQIG